MTDEQGLTILLMSALTLLPRILPAFVSKRRMPKFLEEWAKCIPYASLTALVFPGIFYVDTAESWVGIIGLSVSLSLSLLRIPLFLVVAATVTTIYLYYSLS